VGREEGDDFLGRHAEGIITDKVMNLRVGDPRIILFAGEVNERAGQLMGPPSGIVALNTLPIGIVEVQVDAHQASLCYEDNW